MGRLMVLIASIAVLLVGGGVAASVVSSNRAGGSERWVPTTVKEGFPYAINERGQMVGEGSDSEYDPAMTDAFVWQISAPCKPDADRCGKARALARPLRARCHADWVWASAINDGGSIAGGTDGKRCALLWPPSGTLRVLSPLREGESAEASNVNSRGQIVGWSGGRPVIWQKGQPRALPGGPGKAYAINDRGVIAGTVDGHAVVWEQGKLRRLGTPSGKQSTAVDVNDRGQIIGRAEPKSGAWYAVLWEKSTMRKLGTGIVPAAINNRGPDRRLMPQACVRMGERQAHSAR